MLMMSDVLLITLLAYTFFKKPESLIGAISGGALAFILKLLFRVVRDATDPFSFPSAHAAMAFGAVAPIGGFLFIPAAIVGVLRVLEGQHTLFEAIIGAFTGIVGYFLSDVNRRKAIHISLSIITGYLMLFHNQLTISLVLLVGAIAVYLFRNIHPVKSIYKVAARNKDDIGPITLSLGIFVASLFGTGHVAAFSIGLVDGLAGLMEGSRGKTIHGFLRGVIGALFAGLLLRGLVDWKLIIALPLTAIVEYYSKGDDNIAIGVWWGVIGALLGLLSP